MDQITGDATFVPAVNIPGYDIGTIDNEMAITFPGSDYAGELNGPAACPLDIFPISQLGMMG